MRFTATLDERAAMRPLVDMTEERIAAARGQTLEQYRAEKAAQPITYLNTQPRNPHDD